MASGDSSHSRAEFRTGDDRSFADVFGPFVQPAFRLACAMLHDSQEAEDTVQEASLIAWRKLDRLGDASRLRTWFLGIVANECRNARRRGWRTAVHLGLSGELSVGSAEEQSVRRADLRRALLRLSHEDRLVVSLYFYLDMPLAEIAAVSGTTSDAARQRLYRAVRKLRPGLSYEEAIR